MPVDAGKARRMMRHKRIIVRLPRKTIPAHAQDWTNEKSTLHRAVTRGIGFILVFLLTITVIVAGMVYKLHTSTHANMIAMPAMHTGTRTTTGIRDTYDGKALTMLIIGQDTREGEGNASIGGTDPNDTDNHQSDTMMVLNVNAARDHIDLVSLPRDSMIDQPECSFDGTNAYVPARQQVMLNSVLPTAYNASNHDMGFAVGCLVTTVNSLTGLDITDFVLLDFAGMSNLIDSIGGVDVCLPSDMQDQYTNLNLKQGLNHLDGLQATQYARMRHGTGTDGSDLSRTTRQQYIVKRVIEQVQQTDMLTNPNSMYRLATDALNMTSLSEGLASINTLAGLAWSLRGIDTSSITSMTVPTIPYPADPNRVQWAPEAQQLWESIRTEDNPGPVDTANTDTTADTDNTVNTDDHDDTASNVDNADNADTVNTVDPHTGLVTRGDGSLFNPETGRTVDPDTGEEYDPATGGAVSLNQRYIDWTYCRIG